MRQIPSSSVYKVPVAAAASLDQARRQCPRFEDSDLYDLQMQASLREAIRHSSGSAYDDTIGEIRSRLTAPPYFTLVCGLTTDDSGTLLVALSSAFGELIEPYQRGWSKIIRRIEPAKDRAVDGQVLNECLHTDGTDWNRPNDFTCLSCVRPDQNGDGRSRLLDVDSIVDACARQSGDILKTLKARSVPWRIADELGGGASWAPILSADGSRIRWLRYTIELAFRDGLGDLEQHVKDVLKRFETIIESTALRMDGRLQAGDLLIVDNVRCLHARTAIRQPLESHRLMLRTKVYRNQSDD